MEITYRDDQKIDEKIVCAFFSKYATWKVYPDPEKWKVILENSCAVISAWHNDHLVGLSRGISDKVRFAQVVGVLVHPDYRRRGIGKELVSRLLNTPAMSVRGVCLGTHAMYEFYESLGFKCLNDKAYFMVLVRDELSEGLVLPIDESA